MRFDIQDLQAKVIREDVVFSRRILGVEQYPYCPLTRSNINDETRYNSVGILPVTRYLEVFIPSASIIFRHSGFAPVGVYGEIYCGSPLP